MSRCSVPSARAPKPQRRSSTPGPPERRGEGCVASGWPRGGWQRRSGTAHSVTVQGPQAPLLCRQRLPGSHRLCSHPGLSASVAPALVACSVPITCRPQSPTQVSATVHLCKGPAATWPPLPVTLLHGDSATAAVAAGSALCTDSPQTGRAGRTQRCGEPWGRHPKPRPGPPGPHADLGGMASEPPQGWEPSPAQPRARPPGEAPGCPPLPRAPSSTRAQGLVAVTTAGRQAPRGGKSPCGTQDVHPGE